MGGHKELAYGADPGNGPWIWVFDDGTSEPYVNQDGLGKSVSPTTTPSPTPTPNAGTIDQPAAGRGGPDAGRRDEYSTYKLPPIGARSAGGGTNSSLRPSITDLMADQRWPFLSDAVKSQIIQSGLGIDDYFTSQNLAASVAEERAKAALDLQNKQLAAYGLSSSQSAAINAAEQARQFNIAQQTPTAYQQEQLANDAAQRAFQQQQLEQQAKTSANTLQNQWNTTLAGLSQRPETLLRYMYLARGLQPPEGINNFALPMNAPGSQGFTFSPNGTPGLTTPSTAPQGGGPSSAPGVSAGSAASQPPQLPGAPQYAGGVNQIALTNALNAAHPGNVVGQSLPQFAGGVDLVAQTNALNAQRLGAPSNTVPSVPQLGAVPLHQVGANFDPNAPSVLSPEQRATFERQAAAAAAIRTPGSATYDPEAGLNVRPENAFADGGMLHEPVLGRGLWTGQPYTFNENPEKPETVVPQGKTLADVKGKGGTSSYAKGGKIGKKSATINATMGVGGTATPPDLSSLVGTSPTQMPIRTPMRSYATGGQIGADVSPSFFNPSNLQSVVNAPELAPGIPNLPAIGRATGGGQSLIPSAQTWNSLLPSEQQTYQGALPTQFGAQAQDVSALQDKNWTKPQYRTPLGLMIMGLTAPRYSGNS